MKHFILAYASFLLVHAQSLKAQSDTTFHACLYPESSFTLGLAGIYGFDFSGSGINGRAYYNLGEHFCFGPEASFLSATNKALTDINLVAHYIVDVKGIGIYPVGGINYSLETETGENHEAHRDEAWGIVGGFGIHRNYNRFTLFTEYSHHFSPIPDDLIALGFMMTFHSKQNHKQ